MQVSKEFIAAVMSIAKNLQNQYDIMGAPATQNVRNPYPLHKLIIGVLPSYKGKGLTRDEIQAKLKGYGYKVSSGNLTVTLNRLSNRGTIRAVKIKDHYGRGPKPSKYSFAS